MAAEQATQVAEVPTVVIPTTTIPEGIASLMAFNVDASIEENKEQMTEMSHQVTSGQITYSIRDTEIDGVKINKEDYMGIVSGKIMLSVQDAPTALDQTLKLMMTEETEIVTIIVGEDGSVDEANQIAEELEERFEDVEFEIVEGNQPVYNYIISAE